MAKGRRGGKYSNRTTANAIINKIRGYINEDDLNKGYTDYEISNLFPRVQSQTNFNMSESKNGVVKYVDIAALKTTQAELSVNVLTVYAKNNTIKSSSDLPIVTFKNGSYVILDGNHRAAIAKLSGKKRLKVRLVD